MAEERNIPVEPIKAEPVKTEKTENYRFSPLDKKMIRREGLPDDPEELLTLIESEGTDISSPAFQRQLEVRKKEAYRQSEEQRKRTRTRVEGYDTTRNRILSARDYVALGFSFLFGVVSMLLTTVLLYISETVSVIAGIRSFLSDNDTLTYVIVIVLSIALVSSYFAIEWRMAALIAKNGKPPVYRFTFAMIRDRWNYLWGNKGTNPEFQYQVIENAADIRAINSTRRVIIAVIVILGVLGRLENLLSAETNASWYNQVVSIFTESNLQTFLEYIGGGVIALALLVASHYLISYIYEVYRNAVGGADEVGFFDPALQTNLEQQMLAAFYRKKLQDIWIEREDTVMEAYQAQLEARRQKQLAAQNTIQGQATVISPTVNNTAPNLNEQSDNLSVSSEMVQESQTIPPNTPQIPQPPIPPPNRT